MVRLQQIKRKLIDLLKDRSHKHDQPVTLLLLLLQKRVGRHVNKLINNENNISLTPDPSSPQIPLLL